MGITHFKLCDDHLGLVYSFLWAHQYLTKQERPHISSGLVFLLLLSYAFMIVLTEISRTYTDSWNVTLQWIHYNDFNFTWTNRMKIRMCVDEYGILPSQSGTSVIRMALVVPKNKHSMIKLSNNNDLQKKIRCRLQFLIYKQWQISKWYFILPYIPFSVSRIFILDEIISVFQRMLT